MHTASSSSAGLNGAPVIERLAQTIFIRLPREQWRLSMGGNCICDVCRETGRAAFWDTLAVSSERIEGKNDYTWTCHHPDELAYSPIAVISLDEDGVAQKRMSRTRPEGPGYWTVVVPWSPTPTEWHPTSRDFGPLTRGVFKTEGDALSWAEDKLCGQPCSVQFHHTYEDASVDAEGASAATA